ncbi:MAG: adenylate/guanylate cyclase domain-containing protein [Chloroflexota bacterium]|nr:adenylate/guanylate cyclase domain-containing protein [Chloroflexota bacterium]
MEPQIQYVTTSDGVSIAYYDVGRGAPLVALPYIPWSDVRSEFVAMNFKFHPRLAAEHRLIHYDLRGAGLSQRGVMDFSLAALQLDLDAVINRLDVDRVSLYAEANGAIVALAYAAAHPTRVDRIILWGGFARASDFWGLPRSKAVQSLFEQDWELYTETVAQLIFGFASGEPAQEYAAYMRNCVNEEEAGAHFAAGLRWDVTHLLPSISTPTLLLQPSDAAMAPMAWGRELASSIPRAQLKVLKTGVFWSDEIEEWIIASIRDFLAVMPQAWRAQAAEERFQTVLFTDIVGSTPLMHALGDAAWRRMLSEHERLTREILARHGGAEIKTIGDSFMASFGSASRTVECAIELQRAFAARNAHEPESSLHVRIGVNAGEPVADSDDLFGTAVTLASRIMGQAQGGEILVSDVVRQLVAGRNFVFADRGKTLLKGFEDAVRLYELSWRE